MAELWTMPVSFARGGRRSGLIGGAVVHYVCDEQRVCGSIAEACRSLGVDAFSFPGSTEMLFATQTIPAADGWRSSIEDLSAAALSEFFDPNEGLFGRSVGEGRISIQSGTLRGSKSQWWVGISVASTNAEPGNINRAASELVVFADSVSLLSGGVDLGEQFDPQEFSLFPNPRGDGHWGLQAERQQICGYYWKTFVGPSLRRRLGEVPSEIRSLVKEHSGVAEICLSLDPLDDAEVRATIPQVRAWLGPVLSGWMVSPPSNTPSRLYEGPAVPISAINMISSLRDGRFDLDETGLVREHLGLEPPVSGQVELNVRFRPSSDEMETMAVEGIAGAVSAVVRGLEEGWIEANTFSNVEVDGLRLSTSGTADSTRILLLVLSAVAADFYVPSKNGPIGVVETVDVSVSQVPI